MTAIKNWFKFDKSLFKYTSSLGTLSLFALMLPMLFESVMLNLQNTVNTVVLNGYSDDAVSAVGSTSSVINLTTVLGTMIANGAIVVVSNRIGAEDLKAVKELSFSTIAVNVIISAIVTPAMVLFTPNIVGFLNLEGTVRELALEYFKIRMLFIGFTITTSAVLALLKCYGYPKYTFYVSILVNTINLLLNVVVVYFPQYAPIKGVQGVAFSSSISSIIGLLVAIVFFVKVKIQLKLPDSVGDFLRHLRSVLRIGVPSGLSSVSFTFSKVFTASFIALLGDRAISTNVYFTNILCYVYLFSMCTGNANALLVGRCCGAGEYQRAEKMNAQLIKITTIVNLTISLLIIVFRKYLLMMFTDDPWVVDVALGVFLVDLLVEQARAISQIYEYALRAAGDVLFSMVFIVASCWIFSIGLSYILAIKCGMGLVGCFIGLAVDEWVRTTVTYFRWKSGKWKHIQKN